MMYFIQFKTVKSLILIISLLGWPSCHTVAQSIISQTEESINIAKKPHELSHYSFARKSIKRPPNDLCIDAISLNCHQQLTGTNIEATSDGTDVLTACGVPGKTVWYRFETNASNTTINIEDVDYTVDFVATVITGSCGGPYEIITCLPIAESTILSFETIPGESYLLQIATKSSTGSNFNITVDEGLGTCDEVCLPDYTISTYCVNELDDFFYYDLEISNLGRSTGFMVNDGAYPAITSPGTTTIGPVYAARDTLKLVSLDDPGCVLQRRVIQYCGCTVFEDLRQPYGTVTIIERDSALLRVLYPNDVILPGLHPFDCDIQWITDLADPQGSLVGTGSHIKVSPEAGKITNYFAVMNCTNGLSCELEYSVNVESAELCEDEITGYYPHFPGCTSETLLALYDQGILIDDAPLINKETMFYSFTNGPYPCSSEVKFFVDDCDIDFSDRADCDNLIATASSGTVITWGGSNSYYDYSWQANLNIALEDKQSCEFLYWVTDLSNPIQSIVSTDENATVDIYGGAFITYYGIVVCEEENICVEELTFITPVFDIPPMPPPSLPPAYVDDSEIIEEDDNEDPCPSLSAGTINTIDKYLCFGEKPAVTLIDTEIPTGYSLYYAYHNSTELSTSGFVYALSFDNLVIPENMLPCATAIYLTAFVAPTVSNLSEINLSDACVEMSNTLEITYLCPIQIQVQEICNSNGTYNLAVTVTGGLPQVLGNLPFSIYGTVFKGNANHGQTFTITNLPDGSNYQIEAVDSEMCHDWVTGNVQCDKLPVELLTFEGEAQASGNLLKWSTATEINNDYFTIESSSNGIDFTALGTVKGSGNTSSVSNYHFLDRQASNGITYYRLSQTDFNGNSTIEAVTEVSRGETSDITLLQTYPVPFLDELNLQVYSNSQSEIDINLLDVTGREVLQKRFVLDKGLNEVSLLTKSLPKGLYLIALESKKSISYQKVIKD